ncbi:diacylglycerol kinase [Trichodesmium erythraeum IMS101]|uniref:Diacylglycerol kinase n=1 Tax=Trichodesmium erythraeum (strain IMS101) TaxID=203124 RepID=Q10UY4_TRIEI|nr:diacylglycerol kinase family protein [Trichodesmium erythraeum GBRTRLIN201]MCH2048391.1 diacylglycerol kinase family protein [Trichodesmium sp. ALOHA_ZT_67]MDE5094813.1 diacylglycerol kinase family protein [Trichodesmium sp. St11_bin5]
MKINELSIFYYKAPFIGQPKNSVTAKLNLSKKTVKFNRELSWQVANNILTSFKYAWSGLSYAFQTQRNFRIHTFIGIVAISLSILLKLQLIETVVIVLTIGLVMAMELLNTAIESAVDLTVKQHYHKLAKIAKDCAAAAVLVSAIVALLVASYLILPPLLEMLISAIDSYKLSCLPFFI